MRTSVYAETCIHRPIAVGAVVALFVASLLLAFVAQPVPAYADSGKSGSSRAIAIGLDNSGSMLGDDPSKWCAARYSLEVIAAMLDENDEMALYTMNKSDQGFKVSGSEDAASRVDKVHGTTIDVDAATDTVAASRALEFLKGSSASEKFLIITTDGEFNQVDGNQVDASVAADRLHEIIDEAKNAGVTVVYFVIAKSNATTMIDEDSAHGVYVEDSSADSDDILAAMVRIANRVFARDALPDGSVDAGSGTLAFDVPMSQLVVFAQGENVEIGSLTDADGASYDGAVSNVQYLDRSAVNGAGTYNPDEKLKGVVCLFEGDIPKGGAQVDIKGASKVAVYYTPRVGIAMDLKEAETGISYQLKPGEDNELSAGTYKAELYFVDPQTGETLQSDLLKNPAYSITVESGGQTQGIDPTVDTLTVAPGAVVISAEATTNGNVLVGPERYDINVSPAVSPMRMDTGAVPPVLDLAGFEGARFPVIVAKEDGSAFTAEEWANMELTVEDDTGIEWAVEKSDEPGTLYVTPLLVNGDVLETQNMLFRGLPLDAANANLRFTASSVVGSIAYRANDERAIGYVGDWKLLLPILIPLAICLALLLTLLFLYLTKPRLPRKMRPHLVIASQDEPIALRYNEDKIQNKLSPIGPETVTFSAHAPRDAMEASSLRLAERYELSRIGLVACKKENGKRRFKFDEQTLADMRRHMQNAQEREDSRTAGFPDPDYSPKPAKSFKDQKSSRGMGSTITFTGYNVPPRGKKKQEETYTIYFRKPR